MLRSSSSRHGWRVGKHVLPSSARGCVPTRLYSVLRKRGRTKQLVAACPARSLVPVSNELARCSQPGNLSCWHGRIEGRRLPLFFCFLPHVSDRVGGNLAVCGVPPKPKSNAWLVPADEGAARHTPIMTSPPAVRRPSFRKKADFSSMCILCGVAEAVATEAPTGLWSSNPVAKRQTCISLHFTFFVLIPQHTALMTSPKIATCRKGVNKTKAAVSTKLDKSTSAATVTMGR